MILPPAILDLRIAPAGKRAIHLWLPLFLLWPLLLVIGVLTIVFTAIADVALIVMGRPYHHYTILAARCFALLGETRGTSVRINDRTNAISFTVL